jgi:hypothetical protein
MVDLAGTVAGEFGVNPNFTMTVFLYEGDIQKVENIETPHGSEMAYHVTRSARITDADVRDGKAWVEVFDDEALTYTACGGLPVLRKAATAQNGYIARVLKIEAAKNNPANTSAVTAIADQLSGNLLRKAEVEFVGMQGAFQAECKIPANGMGADSIDAGDPAKFVWDVSEAKWSYVASGGTSMVPLHHLEGSTSVAVEGHVLVGVGMLPVKVQA